MGEKILITDVETEMKSSYIDYAMSVIVGRALPDVRDGLKPVHRRILYAMYQLGLLPEKGFRKSARIVGDVLGKYHPHGDTAVYDAMVRMAQDFSIRYTLVEGHGNFGSVDGDSPAHMRYTEARQTRIFKEMLRDINKNTVDFIPNFDGEEFEPSVLPNRYPNLLVNGTEGIAVGMKTSIPTHNLSEVIDGAIGLIDNPDCSVKDLMQYIKAPDFPTGGSIINKDIKDMYETGTGKVIIRSKYHVELEKGRNTIIIDEIPYQVNKAKLVEDIDYISKNHKEKDKKTKKEKEIEAKIPEISDIRDESDRSGMRIVIELKKGSDVDDVLKRLFKHTKLQDNFSVNMLALVKGEPKVLNLKQILYHFIEYQKEIVTRKSEFDLEKAKNRLHILEGLKIALNNIDKIIEMIRSSKTVSEAESKLMQGFSFSEKQAKYILELKLQRLTALEIDKIELEYSELTKNIEFLNKIISDETVLLGEIKKDLLEIKEKYGDERRSNIIDDDISEMAQIKEVEVENYNVMFFLSNEGYFKKIPLTSLRNAGDNKVKDDDYFIIENKGENKDDILIYTNIGNIYRLKAYLVEDCQVGKVGIYLPKLLELSKGEKIVGLINTQYTNLLDTILIIYKNGNLARISLESYKSNYSVLKGNSKNEILYVKPYNEEDDILFITSEGKALVVDLEGINTVGSRVALGVKGIKIPEGHELVDVVFNPIDNSRIKLETQKKELEIKLKKSYYKGSRNNVGIFIYNTRQNKDRVVSFTIEGICSNP